MFLTLRIVSIFDITNPCQTDSETYQENNKSIHCHFQETCGIAMVMEHIVKIKNSLRFKPSSEGREERSDICASLPKAEQVENQGRKLFLFRQDFFSDILRDSFAS
ncbi:hypothetical protein AVEN_245651-1 [Araneus ventricosus]|uniref:Uncharacterized protein n=1 Tax=Araneus ventricosus TaxID=182803 RepID=A0A4Y2IW50_ARAVE|nr:hypothetical protein AVEN_245651-1 [Araneus ventricosus]